MYHELNISPDERIYYRYNPDADVLAIRLTPQFGPATEEPLPELPEVTLSRDAAGAVVGFRVAGVQQLILNQLIRDVFAVARPHLGMATGPADAGHAAAVGRPAEKAPQPVPAAAPGVPATGAQAEPGTGSGRRRRRRRGGARRSDGDDPSAGAGADAPYDAGSEGAEPEADVGWDLGAWEDDEAVADAGVAAGGGVAADRGVPEDLGAPTAEATSGAPDAGAEEDVPGRSRRRRRRRRPGGRPESPGVADGRPDADDFRSDIDDVRADADDVRSDTEDDDLDVVEVETEAHAASAGPTRGAAAAGPPDLGAVAETPEAFRFAGLDERIGRAIGAMGFDAPTPIQVEGLPVALAGRDMIGLAQTGTGKTLAFSAPALHRILADPDATHRPRCLVLAPTRELVVQVAQEVERLARFTDVRVTTVYGGVGMGPQVHALAQGSDVIVATPGRMLDHLRRGNVRMGSVAVLVLDEADRMLDMGFLPDVRTLLRFLPAERQTMLFTATMPPEIQSLSLEFQREPVVVEIARRKPPETLNQVLYPVGKHLKVPLLIHLLRTDPEMTSVLVFTERKVDADVLARQLRQADVKVALMHGDRRQVDRERALGALRAGSVHVLVATNVAARGLDIEEVSHVVNYDCPQTVDEYVHRVGRTARAKATGKAVTFVTPSDETMITRIETALERRLPRETAPGFDYDVPTPNWAKPSAKDVLAMLDRHQSTVDRLRGLARR